MPFLFSRRPPVFSQRDVKEQLHDTVTKAPSSPSLKSGKSAEHSSTMDTIKRHSKMLTERRPSHGASRSPKLEPRRSAKIDIKVESPPLVSFNTPADSSGALFSAELDLKVIDPEVIIESFKLRLLCTVSVKKPVHQNCPECMLKTSELKAWDFAKENLHLKQGHHPFPFSYLFGGHLPATTRAPLVIVDYHLSAVAKTATGESLTFGKSVHLSRSVLPGNDKHSLRVFPPTNLTASVNLNPVIHPIGDFPVSLHVTGITTKQSDSHMRWRLRKLSWRIEERQKMISPACQKHAAKLGGEGKGILHEDVRSIGEGEVEYSKTPWKCDFDSGEIDSEFKCAVNHTKNPACDVEAQNGLSITHSLVLEMVVAEEWTPKGKPNQITPTGAARILRTQFHVLLTNRAGLGISWDEETPPIYEDVPASPPAYAKMTDFDLGELDGLVEDFHLDPNTGAHGTLVPTSSRDARLPSYSPSRLTSSVSPSRVASSHSPSRGRPSTSGGRNLVSVDDLMVEPQRRPQADSPDDEEVDDVQIVQS